MTIKKRTLIIITFTILLLVVGYFLYMRMLQTNNGGNPDNKGVISQFWPFGRGGVVTPLDDNDDENNDQEDGDDDLPLPPVEIPKLRQLSDFPIGGYYATTTASSTSLARFIHRGTGHVYEAVSDSIVVEKISNTTLPMVVESYWSASGNAFLARYIEGGDEVTNFYTELKEIKSVENSTSTSESGASQIKFELRGRSLWSEAREIAISPKKDRVFAWFGGNDSASGGVGYIGGLDEKGKVEIFNIPAVQFNVDWPNESTVTLTTKGTGYGSGLMYGINTRSGEVKKIVPATRGLSGVMSKDGSSVFISKTRGNGIDSNFFNVSTGESEESVFRTFAEKCAWSTLRPKEIYCAVPIEIPNGQYPDDWYKGDVSFGDQIWHLDRETGEVHLLSNPLKDAEAVIDAVQLSLDTKENTLYFVNKKDLTLWALDLTK